MTTVNGVKLCSTCGQGGEFSKNAAREDGLQNECNDCRILRKYKVRYSLDGDTVLEWFARGCFACGATESQGHRSKRLQIDHDHETGQARGALCASCNKALGHLRDDPDRVASLLAYVLSWE